MSKVKDDWTVKVFDSLAGLGIAALIALPIQRYQDGIADALDKYALRFMLALFLILLAPMVAIPAAYFYGRYLDVGLIIFFTVLSVMGRFADCNLSLLQGGHKKRGSK